MKTDIDKLKLFLNSKKEKAAYSQNQLGWIRKNNIKILDNVIANYKHLTVNEKCEKYIIGYKKHEDYKTMKSDLKLAIQNIVHGKAFCKNCGKEIIKPGCSGFKNRPVTCNKKCEYEYSSKRMKNNNPVYNFTDKQKENIAKKQSKTMKKKIMDGKFTPKSENYYKSEPIKINHPIYGKKIIRSAWELLFWAANPELEYETFRKKYYDGDLNKERIYILDFYDKKTKTVYEIKPKKYINSLKWKIKEMKEDKSVKFQIISEKEIEKYSKDSNIIETAIDWAINKEVVEQRMKWIK